jgi:hypothetical protein
MIAREEAAAEGAEEETEVAVDEVVGVEGVIDVVAGTTGLTTAMKSETRGSGTETMMPLPPQTSQKEPRSGHLVHRQ